MLKTKSYPVLEAINLRKSYGSTIALDGVSLKLSRGRVHALMGENGAGKSTLIRILVGAARPTSGELRLDGKAVVFEGVSSAIKAGIVPIYQHLTLFPKLSVIENLFAFDSGHASSRPAYLSRGAHGKAQSSLERVGLDVGVDRQVDTLSLSERQLLEIARGIQCDCKVLLLDEPTAALNRPEAERLGRVVADLASQGVAIVYISHKSDEVRSLADDVTVMRDGKSVVAGIPLAETQMSELVNAMVGHTFTVSDRTFAPAGNPVVQISGLRIRTEDEPVDLTIGRGEVIGLAGLIGSGADDIAAALAGAARCHAGAYSIAGETLPLGNRRRALHKGVGYVPPDRHDQGLFENCSALANASASILERVSSAFVLKRRKERELLTPLFHELALSPNEPERSIGEFSGGNQQKALLTRNLALGNCRLLVLVEPTRGVDVAARDKIHAAIERAASTGVAVLLVTTDLEELTSLSHRIFIVRDRSLSAKLKPGASPDEVSNALLSVE